MQHGFLLINKPPGPTSHDIIDRLRRITGIKTIGHAGTLDPFASGLLIVGVGREATKQLDEFKNLDKTYRAVLKLGATSDTFDRTGQVTRYKNLESGIWNLEFPSQLILDILMRFEGPQLQVPPMYSAKKIGGKKLYKLARKGQSIERKPQWIMVFQIKDVRLKIKDNTGHILPQSDNLNLKSISSAQCSFTVRCSSGTYIRALAHDIGQALGCGAYLQELKRSAIGPYKLKNAIRINRLTSDNWKIFSQETLKSEILNLKSVLVLVFGTFDGLHPGHINFFEQARLNVAGQNLGGLIVGVARDKVAESIKRRRPRMNEMTRLKEVRTCPLVDAAYLLPDDPSLRFEWIKRINPDVIALGYDQSAFVDDLEIGLKKIGCKPAIIRLQPYKPDEFKSSLMT